MVFVKFLLLLVLSTSCQTVFSQDDKFVKAANCFSLELMKAFPPPNGNGIISPFSVDTVLSMLLLGARGSTADELKSVLKANDMTIDEIKQGFRSAMQKLTSNKNVTVNIANAMWTDQSFTVNPNYKKDIQDNFMADQRSGDFKTNAPKATNDINGWVNNKTMSMIDKLFDKPLESSTVMVLLNAIYFKGSWLNKFDKANTQNQPFYNNGDQSKSKMVPFMNQQKKFAYKYDSKIKAKVLRMDYTGGKMYNIFFLPDEGVKLDETEMNINCDTIKEVLELPDSSKVNVKIPKYETTSDMDLGEALKKLGLNKVFGGGDLSGIGPGRLALTKIVQKAEIKVDEEGSVAAAATGGAVNSLAIVVEPKIEEFFADRPFCYFIVDKASGLILFGGKLSQF